MRSLPSIKVAISAVLLTLTLGGCGSGIPMFDEDSGMPTEPCDARMTDSQTMIFACDDNGSETTVKESQLWRDSVNGDNVIKQTLALNGGAVITDHSRRLEGGYRIIVQDVKDRRWTYVFDEDGFVRVELHMS